MRVVSGTAKGRRLQAPPGAGTRPTSDRVREAVFSALESMGVVRDATVVDLFAGTGAMGIEALSRGARHVTFVDAAPAAIRAIDANLAATGLAAGASVVRADVLAWLATNTGPLDLAFADPPYAFDEWAALGDRLEAGTLVAESDREPDLGGRWEVLRRKRYGTTVVVIACPTPTP
jgi:16S rRNA (guanine966-N2)-methyltransferase